MDTKILLENGTNELEVLEFVLDGNAYGINVTINNPPSLETPLCRQFFKSIAVIIVSLGIKIPSILGCAFGTGVTG